MIQKFKKIISILFILVISITNSIQVFADSAINFADVEKSVNINRNVKDLMLDHNTVELSNSSELGLEDINKELQELYPKGEIVAVKETPYGTAYYIDKDYHNPYKTRFLWDALDVVMAGASWAELLGEPSLANLGWAALDTVALLPGLPSSAYVRKGGKILLNVPEVRKFIKTSEGLRKLKKALKPVKVAEETSELVRLFKLAKNYKLSNKSFKHIIENHAYNSVTNKSKFKKGFDIKAGIEKVLTTDSVIKNNTKHRDGYIFIQEFGKTIGYDGKRALTKLKVVLSESGYVITAYPIR